MMGKAMAMDGLRKKVFLMTNNCERDYAGSMKNLEDSLRRLKTDCIDLWQFHECNYDNDPDWIFDKGGMKAALEAKKQGKIRSLDSLAIRILASICTCLPGIKNGTHCRCQSMWPTLFFVVFKIR